jgi:hypothetical protein
MLPFLQLLWPVYPQKVNVDEVGESDFEIYPEEITYAVKVGLEELIYP